MDDHGSSAAIVGWDRADGPTGAGFAIRASIVDGSDSGADSHGGHRIFNPVSCDIGSSCPERTGLIDSCTTGEVSAIAGGAHHA